MSTARTFLVLLCALLCSADQISFSQQGPQISGLRSRGRLEGDASGVRFVEVSQEADIDDSEVDSQQALSTWPASSLFMQSWVEQQLSALDSLNALSGLLVPRCAHSAPLATPPQSDYPSLLTYMASSRFGPTLTTYARQVDQDLQPNGFSLSVYSGSGDLVEMVDVAEADAEQASSGALNEADMRPGLNSVDELQSLDNRIWFGTQQDADLAASAAADDDRSQGEPLFRSSALTSWDPTIRQTDSVPPQEGDLAWGDTCNVALFFALCIGCVVVWVGLMRAWVACCRLEKQTQAKRSAAAQHYSPNPLLAPLIPEGATRNPAFVDLPTEHAANGRPAAQGTAEFVRIAYMPLQSEAEARSA